MHLPRYSRFLLPLVVLCGFLSCEDNDTTTAPGAIASLTVATPDSATSGQSFTVDVTALNIGVSNINNGRVSLTLPAPLTVESVDAEAGTTATFTPGTPATVTWVLSTLDANSDLILHVQVTGTLPNGSPPQPLVVQATLTADGINAGDAVSQDTVTLNP